MTTRKFKEFEYAAYPSPDASGSGNHCAHLAFDTPKGYIFALAGGGEGAREQVGEVLDRLRYYFDNEPEEGPEEAVANALVYVNGYLYAQARKQEKPLPGGLSCLCLLFHQGKLHYAWQGDVCLQLFRNKRLIRLCPGPGEHMGGDKPGSAGTPASTYLGRQQALTPAVPDEVLIPLNADMLLAGAGDFCRGLDGKMARKLLADSMPTHTKVLRLAGSAGEKAGDNMAVSLLHFYNLAAAGAPESLPGREDAPPRKRKSPLTKWATGLLLVVAALLVAYMVYDLFIFDPVPVRPTDELQQPVLLPDTADVREMPEAEAEADVEPVPAIPDDLPYTVSRGDSWGSIYRRFGVCSWFIRNHEPNQGQFDRSGNPVAGTRLLIPVVYSARESLNPDYYTEFTTDKVGSTCQHANQDFIRRFERDVLGWD